MESSNTSNPETKLILMKVLLSVYDNTEYAWRSYNEINIPDDAENVMCDMFLSELKLQTPHIVFAEIIEREQGNIMKTNVMSLDTLKYYLKDPEHAIFTNWVVNNDGSSFSQLYYTKLTGERIRLGNEDNPSEAAYEDLLGGPNLFMDSLDTGMGGVHGERNRY